jgi:hypothetical protein
MAPSLVTRRRRPLDPLTALGYFNDRFFVLFQLWMAAASAGDLSLAKQCLQAQRECVIAELLILPSLKENG